MDHLSPTLFLEGIFLFVGLGLAAISTAGVILNITAMFVHSLREKTGKSFKRVCGNLVFSMTTLLMGLECTLLSVLALLMDDFSVLAPVAGKDYAILNHGVVYVNGALFRPVKYLLDHLFLPGFLMMLVMGLMHKFNIWEMAEADFGFDVEHEGDLKPVIEALRAEGFYRHVADEDRELVRRVTLKRNSLFVDIKPLPSSLDYQAIDPASDATRRVYYVDFRRLYEAEPGVAVNEIVGIADSLALPVDLSARDKISDDLNEFQKSITGSLYAQCDAYAAAFAKLINEKILPASRDKIYLRGGGNDGQMVFLTEGMFSMIAKIDRGCLRRA